MKVKKLNKSTVVDSSSPNATIKKHKKSSKSKSLKSSTPDLELDPSDGTVKVVKKGSSPSLHSTYLPDLPSSPLETLAKKSSKPESKKHKKKSSNGSLSSSSKISAAEDDDQDASHLTSAISDNPVDLLSTNGIAEILESSKRRRRSSPSAMSIYPKMKHFHNMESGSSDSSTSSIPLGPSSASKKGRRESINQKPFSELVATTPILQKSKNKLSTPNSHVLEMSPLPISLHTPPPQSSFLSPLQAPSSASSTTSSIASPKVKKKSKKNSAASKSKGTIFNDSSKPHFTVDPSKVTSAIRVPDLRDLILYLTCDGRAPTWVGINQSYAVQRVLTVHVPALSPELFKINVRNQQPQEFTAPKELKAFEKYFSHAWVIEAPGGKYSVSPPSDTFHYITPSPADKRRKKKMESHSTLQLAPAKKCGPMDMILSVEQLLFNNYPIHPNTPGANITSSHNPAILEAYGHDWVDTVILERSGEGNKKRKEDDSKGPRVFAIDCEMCQSRVGKELTRVTVLDEQGSTLLDELVKPENEIIDYLTIYSGITKEMLENVETKLSDIQKIIRDMISAEDIIVGHSLENDLNALKMRHPRIIDTALSFRHPTNPYQKPSLKHLTKEYLRRDIQTGRNGHDSCEDAKACIDLLELKYKYGLYYGCNHNSDKISIVEKLELSPRISQLQLKNDTDKSTRINPVAVIDYGVPSWAYNKSQSHSFSSYSSSSSSSSSSSTIVSCTNDDEVIESACKHTANHYFTWAKLQELELLNIPTSKITKYLRNKHRESQSSCTRPVGILQSPSSSSQQTSSDVVMEEADDEDTSSNNNNNCSLSRKSSTSTSTTTTSSIFSNSSSSSNSSSNPGVGLSSSSSSSPPPKAQQVSASSPILLASYQRLNDRLDTLLKAVPPNTAVIVWTGQGDTNRMLELHAKRTRFTYEYNSRNWKEVSCTWDTNDEQELQRAVEIAKRGIAFMTIT